MKLHVAWVGWRDSDPLARVVAVRHETVERTIDEIIRDTMIDARNSMCDESCPYDWREPCQHLDVDALAWSGVDEVGALWAFHNILGDCRDTSSGFLAFAFDDLRGDVAVIA